MKFDARSSGNDLIDVECRRPRPNGALENITTLRKSYSLGPNSTKLLSLRSNRNRIIT